MPSEGPGVYLMVIITPILFFNTQDVIYATNPLHRISSFQRNSLLVAVLFFGICCDKSTWLSGGAKHLSSQACPSLDEARK